MKRKLSIAIALVTITGLSAAAMYVRRGDDAPEVATGSRVARVDPDRHQRNRYARGG